MDGIAPGIQLAAQGPWLYIIVILLVAIALGVVIDAVAGWLSRRKTADGTAL